VEILDLLRRAPWWFCLCFWPATWPSFGESCRSICRPAWIVCDFHVFRAGAYVFDCEINRFWVEWLNGQLPRPKIFKILMTNLSTICLCTEVALAFRLYIRISSYKYEDITSGSQWLSHRRQHAFSLIFETPRYDGTLPK
jgi:hypothetical protein